MPLMPPVPSSDPIGMAQQSYAQDLASQASAIKNQYLTPMMQSQLALSQARVPHLLAQTSLTQAQAQALPEQTRISEQGALDKLAALRMSQSPLAMGAKLGKVMRSMPQSVKGLYGTQHVPFLTGVMGRAGAQVLRQPQAIPNVLTGASQPMQPQQAPPQVAATMQQPTIGDHLARAVMPQTPSAAATPQTPSVGAEMPVGSPYTSAAQQDVMEQAANREENKKLVSPQLTNRFNNAKSFDTTLRTPAMQKAFQTMAKYSNVWGESKAYINSQFGGGTYADIESAKKQALPIIAGGIKYLENLPTSDEGLKVGLSYFNKAKTLWNSNPRSAMRFLQNGLDLLHSESAGIYTAAQPYKMVDQIPQRIVIDPNTAGRIRMINPNGDAGTLPANQVLAAIKAGWKKG